MRSKKITKQMGMLNWDQLTEAERLKAVREMTAMLADTSKDLSKLAEVNWGQGYYRPAKTEEVTHVAVDRLSQKAA